MKTNIESSKFIKDQMYDYSLYTLHHRALVSLADGVKAGARRILWVAKRQDKWKSATLAGATMALHPHGDSSLETAINTLAAPYGNNYPLLTGIGSFGTRLVPNAYGASRYTSVKISDFAKKAFYVDMDIIPMTMNYDNTLEEPLHFLPLVPITLLNPIEGVASGFACDILSRSLEDVISAQLAILDGKALKGDPIINFFPFNNASISKDEDKYVFEGAYDKTGSSSITITNLPYGITHDKFVKRLNQSLDDENSPLKDYSDESKDKIKIICKISSYWGATATHADIIKVLGLQTKVPENMNVIDFSGDKVIVNATFNALVEKFTNWRLTFFKLRYENLSAKLKIDIEKLQDIIKAIDNNVGGKAIKMKDKAELKQLLVQIKVIHIDYIAGLPVYRFTIDERTKTEEEIIKLSGVYNSYQEIINSPKMQMDIYKQELKQLKKDFC